MRGDLTWGVIEKDMQGLARRVQATAQNIANANTPKYSRREVSFEDQLKQVIESQDAFAMNQTNDKHFTNVLSNVEDVAPFERKVGNEIYRLDSNNVDPETEMARLTETRMMYQGMTRIMGKKIAMYRRAIGGGA